MMGTLAEEGIRSRRTPLNCAHITPKVTAMAEAAKDLILAPVPEKEAVNLDHIPRDTRALVPVLERDPVNRDHTMDILEAETALVPRAIKEAAAAMDPVVRRDTKVLALEKVAVMVLERAAAATRTMAETEEEMVADL